MKILVPGVVPYLELLVMRVPQRTPPTTEITTIALGCL